MKVISHANHLPTEMKIDSIEVGVLEDTDIVKLDIKAKDYTSSILMDKNSIKELIELLEPYL